MTRIESKIDNAKYKAIDDSVDIPNESLNTKVLTSTVKLVVPVLVTVPVVDVLNFMTLDIKQ